MSGYIDKQAFISQVTENYCKDCTHRKNDKGVFVYEIGGVRCRACDIGDMIDAVDDFTAADVTHVVHGHWCEDEFDVWCSICYCAYPKDGTGIADWRKISKYCDNCGAKMGENEERCGDDNE